MYILRCNDNSYYVGHTDNLEERIQEHSSKFHKGYTSDKLPIVLVYSQIFESRETALIAENKIKKWSRAKKEALINGDFNELVRLSKKKF